MNSARAAILATFATLASLGAAGQPWAQPQSEPSPQPQPPPAGIMDHAMPPPPATPPAAAEPRLRPMPENARVYILWPPDGAVIQGGFWLRMGLAEAGVAPAGVQRDFTGHHHVLVDVPLPPLDLPILNDRNHLHFGLGQTEARLDLPTGRHTLQLLLGDENHVPHDPPLYSRQITITVVR